MFKGGNKKPKKEELNKKLDSLFGLIDILDVPYKESKADLEQKEIFDEIVTILETISKKELNTIYLGREGGYGNTVLMQAICSVNLPVVKLVIEKGASLGKQGKKDLTALQTAQNFKEFIDTGVSRHLRGDYGNVIRNTKLPDYVSEIIEFIESKLKSQQDQKADPSSTYRP